MQYILPMWYRSRDNNHNIVLYINIRTLTFGLSQLPYVHFPIISTIYLVPHTLLYIINSIHNYTTNQSNFRQINFM